MSDRGAGAAATWPAGDLEKVDRCPICSSAQRTLRHQAVEDWSFGCAPGHWSYWTCDDCSSLYLNPRPTVSTIGRAYVSYYTHRAAASGGGFRGLKLRWKNERLSLRLGADITPRLGLPGSLHAWANRKAQNMALPFGWDALAALPPGRFMDVGCGSGVVLNLAQRMGWQAEGLEFDSVAVASARHAGLTVTEGGYERLHDWPQAFDALLCSHVIEHVHDPRAMVEAMHVALRPGGTLLLSTPNAQSDVHRFFGRYWRGLEAPRHLTLFNEAALVSLLELVGFDVASHADDLLETVRESRRIARVARGKDASSYKFAPQPSQMMERRLGGHDFIKLSALKR